MKSSGENVRSLAQLLSLHGVQWLLLRGKLFFYTYVYIYCCWKTGEAFRSAKQLTPPFFFLSVVGFIFLLQLTWLPKQTARKYPSNKKLLRSEISSLLNFNTAFVFIHPCEINYSGYFMTTVCHWVKVQPVIFFVSLSGVINKERPLIIFIRRLANPKQFN